jgi:CO/xanthine dehydrogenase Mo-binding subunit
MLRLPKPSLPGDLAAAPRLDRWLTVAGDGTILLFPGKVEIGQGLLTALAQIAADELDVPLAHIRLHPATTGQSPDEGVTSGSLSVSTCGMAIRQVAAEVRALFVAEAARRLGSDPALISIVAGRLRGIGNLSLGYGELAEAVSLARDADGLASPKVAGLRSVAGQSAPRLDIAGRVTGQRPTIHDLAMPGMLHGRVLRASCPGATLLDCDETAISQSHPTARVIRDGSFLGVVAASEREAESAAQKLARTTRWSNGFTLPDADRLAAWLEGEPVETETVDQRGDGAEQASPGRLTRDYLKPFLAHGSIAPSCAIAEWRDGRPSVWSSTQGVYNLRTDLALVFGCDAESITVSHRESAGCYGHNGADDVALDAALLARAVPDHAVRVQWSRADELTHSPLGAAMLMRLSADLDPDGTITGWRHDLWSNGHTARPGRARTPALLASWDIETPFPRLLSTDPPLASGGGAQRNAVPLYDFANWTIRKHRVLSAPLRTSSMRSLGAIGNVFAIESFMDELAAASGQDALAFRLRHLSDIRARAVLERVADMCGWTRAPRREGFGLGLAFARYKNTGGYCAVAAEVNVTDEPRATRLWIAADMGEVINPDGAINQIEGGAIQSVSWALKEEVRFSRRALECGSWESYPILRFSEVPQVEVSLIERPDEPPLGAGEVAQGPTAAALANAIHAALSVRIRQMPFTRARLLAAME